MDASNSSKVCRVSACMRALSFSNARSCGSHRVPAPEMVRRLGCGQIGKSMDLANFELLERPQLRLEPRACTQQKLLNCSIWTFLRAARDRKFPGQCASQPLCRARLKAGTRSPPTEQQT